MLHQKKNPAGAVAALAGSEFPKRACQHRLQSLKIATKPAINKRLNDDGLSPPDANRRQLPA